MGYFRWYSASNWGQRDRPTSRNSSWLQRDVGSVRSYGFKEQMQSADPAIRETRPVHKDGLETKIKVPSKMAEDMRSSVAHNIGAKAITTVPTHQQPQSNQRTSSVPGSIQPPTGLIIEDGYFDPEADVLVALELGSIQAYKKCAMQNSDDTVFGKFWSDLEAALEYDCEDLRFELCSPQRDTSDSSGPIHVKKHKHSAQAAHILGVHQSPQTSVHSFSPPHESSDVSPESEHHSQTPEPEDTPSFNEPPELTVTATIPPSSQHSTQQSSLPSSDTSESNMDDRIEFDENELYRRVRQFHDEARQISLRLHPLRLRRKNFDKNLDKKEQKILNDYRVQLAAREPHSSVVLVDAHIAFEVEKILTRKRDAIGPLIDEIQELEQELYSVQSRERQVEDQLHRHYATMSLVPIGHGVRPESVSEWDEESEASELELFDPSDYHPLYNEWQDHEARLKNLQEKLWAYEEEEARLSSQKEVRKRVGRHLAKDDEEELAALPGKIADLRLKFGEGEEESKRLREECLRLKIIDDHGKPRQNLDEDTEHSQQRTGREDSITGEDRKFANNKAEANRDSLEHKDGDIQFQRLEFGQESLKGRRGRQEESGTVDNGGAVATKEDGIQSQDPKDHQGTVPDLASPTMALRDEHEEPKQQQDLTLKVSPPSENEGRYPSVDHHLSESGHLSPSGLLIPSTRKPPASQFSEYRRFTLSSNRNASAALPNNSDPLSVDAWLFDQLVDSGTERRLLATILKAKGAADYEELEESAQKVVHHWNDDSYAAGNWSPASTNKDLRESVEDIKREGYDKLLVEQVLGYAFERGARSSHSDLSLCSHGWASGKTENEYSD